MKTIDWTKPVRFTTGDPLKVIATHRGKAFVTWGTEATAHSVAEDGRVETVGGYYVENVPEELYLRLCPRGDGSYALDGAGKGGVWGAYQNKQALPLQMWRDYYRDAVEAGGCFLVKVPV